MQLILFYSHYFALITFHVRLQFFPILVASTAKFVSVFVNIGMQGFQNLTSLTELDLSDNNISVLPPELVRIWNPFTAILIL